MIDEETREAVVTYAQNHGVDEAALLFEGIVSKSTIYRWMADHLMYGYTLEECHKEYSNYKKLAPRYMARIGTNRLVHTFQPHFFHKERTLWKNPKIRKKLLENRRHYLKKQDITPREILRGFKISGIHIGYSHFSPLWLVKFVEDYGCKSIYDPCGGWGHRLIGAGICGCDYIYNDKWSLSVEGAKAMAKELGITAKFYNNCCMSFQPEEDYDSVFTCPPYYNTEVYEEEFVSISEYWLFLYKMIQNAVKPSVNYLGIVINRTYEKHVIQNVLSAVDNFTLFDIHKLGTTEHISHLNDAEKAEKEEVLLVFKRTSLE